MTTRLAAPSVLGALAAIATLAWGSGNPAASTPGARGAGCALTASRSVGIDPRDSAQKCGLCHTEFLAEWQGRAHARAWTDEVYQEALKGTPKPEACHGCHIPGDVHARLGRKPRPRTALLDEGVTCVSCHKSGGSIHGPFGTKTDAHPTAKNPAFTKSGSVHLCASCHGTKIGPVLPLARDYKAYRKKHGDDAKTCVECHMPEVERHLAVSIVTGEPVGKKVKTRMHKVLGPGDAEFCARAFAFSASADGADLVLGITNRAGHRIPGLTLRRFDVTVTQLTAADKQLSEHSISISHENGIDVVEAREFRFDLAKRAAKVRVAVDHVFRKKTMATILTKTMDL